jgi:hypothetical protein
MVHRISHATGMAVALTDQPAGASGQAGPRRPLPRANVLPSLGDGALQPRAQGAEASAASRARASVVSVVSVVSAVPAHDGCPVRTDALRRLSRIRDRFVALLQGNWRPGKMDKAFDAAMMPTLVAQLDLDKRFWGPARP